MSARPAAPAETMQVDPAPTALLGVDPQIALLPPDPRRRAGGTVREMSGTPARTPPFTPRRRATADPSRPTVIEIVEESMIVVDMTAVGAPVLPGFLLCVPGLVLVIVPVVAIGLLTAAAGLVILLAAVPVLVGWRVARRLRHGLAARRAARALITSRSTPRSRRSSAEPTAL